MKTNQRKILWEVTACAVATFLTAGCDSLEPESHHEHTAGASGSTPQITGVLGSPGATTSISGKQLPAPEPKFGGVIKDDALQSKQWWAPRIVPPKKAPNILLILTDDANRRSRSQQSSTR